MSPRFIRVTVFLVVIIGLFAAAYYLVPRLGVVHKTINTAGKLIYLSDAESPGKPHVWIINQDGTGAVDLTPGSQSCTDPVFSPDGSQIAYVSDKGGDAQVYIVAADGTGARVLTFGSSAKEQPSFSPDGKTLTYITQGTLTALDLQSNDTTLLLPPPTAATSTATSALIDVAHAPVSKYYWSPEPASSGEEIAAVQESEDGDLQVLTLLPGLTGTPKVILGAPNVTAAWNPSGSQLYIAVLGARSSPTQYFSGVVTISAAGAPVPVPLLAASSDPILGPTDPSVSPDGTQILFSALREKNLADQHILGLYTQVTDGSAGPKMIASGSASNAQWSPDGTRVLVLAPIGRTPKRDLWVLTPDGSSKPLNLTGGKGNVTEAEWSPSLAKANS